MGKQRELQRCIYPRCYNLAALYPELPQNLGKTFKLTYAKLLKCLVWPAGSALVGGDVLPPAFPGDSCSMIPDPSHMQNPPPHIGHLPLLDALASQHSSILLSFTHLPFSSEQASLQFTTVDSELRLRLLSLHVARLTNLTNPPTNQLMR